MNQMFYMQVDVDEFNIPFNGDLSSWDVARVTGMREMFFNGSSMGICEVWALWRESRVCVKCSSMPRSSMGICRRGTWRESRSVRQMFFNAQVFNGDMSSWDVASVTDMNSMFLQAYAFNGDMSSHG